MSKIARALISVSDKSGLVPLAQALVDAGVQIISTGGTAKALQTAGLEVTELSAHTGFPEMLDGRVKTLHPKVHGGLLFVRGNETHEAAVAEHDIAAIDLVIVNLYPFEATVAKPDVAFMPRGGWLSCRAGVCYHISRVHLGSATPLVRLLFRVTSLCLLIYATK